eukprot:3171654-Amphidinium_carterae.1
MSHGKQALSPAPAPSVASTHMGPRILGLSNPGHRFPPRPVQPGQNSGGPAGLQVCVDNKGITELTVSPIGPAQPGRSKSQLSARSYAARRSLLLATWAQLDRDTPAPPGVLRMPSAHSSSIFQVGVPC